MPGSLDCTAWESRSPENSVDTIYIPQAGGYVALVGKVNSPAVYELKTNSDSIGSLLDFAGGLPVVADPRRAYLERIPWRPTH